MLVAGKFLVYFVAFKALSTYLFWTPLSIIASALIALVICGIEYFVYVEFVRQRARGQPLPLLAGYAGAVILVSSIAAAMVIAFAFSQEFWRRTVGQHRGYGESFFDHYFMSFVFMIALPILANLAFFIWAIRPRR